MDIRVIVIVNACVRTYRQPSPFASLPFAVSTIVCLVLPFAMFFLDYPRFFDLICIIITGYHSIKIFGKIFNRLFNNEFEFSR